MSSGQFIRNIQKQNKAAFYIKITGRLFSRVESKVHLLYSSTIQPLTLPAFYAAVYFYLPAFVRETLYFLSLYIYLTALANSHFRDQEFTYKTWSCEAIKYDIFLIFIALTFCWLCWFVSRTANTGLLLFYSVALLPALAVCWLFCMLAGWNELLINCYLIVHKLTIRCISYAQSIYLITHCQLSTNH